MILTVLGLVAMPLLVPGFFSHDELEWLARADVAHWSDLPWISWSDWQTAQYRPLTFNLWLTFAWLGGYNAALAHLPNVVLGLGNAILLMMLARSYRLARVRAWWVAALFLVGPYAVYTHAWVGTLADLLVLACVLASALWLRRDRAQQSVAYYWSDLAVVVPLTAMALASKESAVVMPGLLALVAYRHDAPKRVWVSILVSGVLIFAYLSIRLHAILYGTSTAGQYSWSLGNIPLALARYLIFPWAPNTLELHTVLLRADWRLYLGILGCVGLLAVLWRAGRYWPGVFLVAVVMALAPVLILEHPGNQYAYLASATACLIVAVATENLGRAWRIGLRVLLVLYVWHGLWVAYEMIAVGRVQANLYADLVPHLTGGTDQLVTVRAQRSGDDWMLQRMLFHTPSYQGVAIEGRVARAPAGTAARFLMQHDGHLIPAAQSMPSPRK